MLYRKKPVVISAEQWLPGKTVSGVCFCHKLSALPFDVGPDIPHVHTLEGIMVVSPGDYIITGIKGEQYPCKSDIFEQTYEALVEGCENGNEALLEKLD